MRNAGSTGSKTFGCRSRVLVCLAALSLASTGFACRGGGDGTSAAGSGPVEPALERYKSLAAFQADAAVPRTSPQVVFIGIDGATWRFVRPLIEGGKVPNLERIVTEGAAGTLRSVPCYVSPPAWTSMHAGYSPDHTGVYTFGKWNEAAREFEQISAADVRVPSVWDIASQAGKRTAVTNIPLTYPVRAVNGIMVSGLMTPIVVHDPPVLEAASGNPGVELADVAPEIHSFSPPRRTVAEDTLNVFVWWRIDATDDGTANYDRVVLNVFPKQRSGRTAGPGRSYVFEIGEFSPWVRVRAMHESAIHDAWCKFLLFERPDGRFEARLSKTLFDVADTGSQYTYPESLAGELATHFEYYMPSKFLERRVVPSVTAEAATYASYFYDYDDWDLFYYVFTQTDNIHHLEGFTPRAERVYEAIDRFLGELIARLPAESTLIIASDHGFGTFDYGIDLNKLFELMGLLARKPDGRTIDFDRTLVFHNMWHLYFNHDLVTRDALEKRGIEITGGETPVDALSRYLVGTGRNLASTGGGLRFPLEFSPVRDDVAGDDPDMVVRGTYDGYLVEFWNIKRPREGVVWKLLPSERHNHERDGVFIAWGAHVKHGYRAATRSIEDIAPTMLYLLGLPMASDMDGRPIYDVFDPAFVRSTPARVVPDFEGVPREFVATEGDKEPLMKKLRSLGYVH